jgi:hypothetical protein
VARTFWFCILSWSTLSHSSTIAILAIVITAALILRLRWHLPTSGVLLLACGVSVGLAGELAFYKGVQHLSGESPVRPPFVMARLVADGPGREYLQDHCPQRGFVLCRHLGSLSNYSDSFLWSENPADGVFSVIPNAERRQLAGEEWRFVGAVVREYPLAVLRSSASSVWDQATSWSLGEFNLNPTQAAELIAKLPARVGNQLIRSRAYRGAMPVRASEIICGAVTASGLMLVLLMLYRGDRRHDLRIFMTTILLGVVADIAVCGALSTPHDRYAMRVLWLLPTAALVGLSTKYRRARLPSAPGEDAPLISEKPLQEVSRLA